MRTNYKDYPSSIKVKEAIKKFEKTNWPKFQEGDDINEFVKNINNIILNELNIFPNILLQLEPKLFGFGIFRVRPIDSFTNIDLFAEHSYPPLNFVKLGRCNFPKFPIFYSSNNPLTALAEVLRENDFKNQKFCISSWEIIPSDNKFIFESFLQTKLNPKNPFIFLAKSLVERINEPFKGQLGKDKEKALLTFLKYIDSQFVEDNNYSFSASLAHRRFYGKHNFCTDILMYPSIQTEMQGVNLAISPNFVDNHMRIKRFYIVEVNHYDKITGQFNISILKYGEILKNIVFWKTLDPLDENYKKAFEEDFQDSIDKNHKYKFEKI
jgi:hypothetical protein